MDSEDLMVKTLLNHKDWRATSWIMKNRWPQKYRDKVEQEFSGQNGEAIQVAIKPFQVIISGAADARSQQHRAWDVIPYADRDKSGLS